MPPKVLTIREALKHPLRRKIVAYLLEKSRSISQTALAGSRHKCWLFVGTSRNTREGRIMEQRRSKRLELFVNSEVFLTIEEEFTREEEIKSRIDTERLSHLFCTG